MVRKDKPNGKVGAGESMWSADPASENRRIEPHPERFHLNVADGHNVPTILFFPDLVAAIRKYASIPFFVEMILGTSYGKEVYGESRTDCLCSKRRHRI